MRGSIDSIAKLNVWFFPKLLMCCDLDLMHKSFISILSCMKLCALNVIDLLFKKKNVINLPHSCLKHTWMTNRIKVNMARGLQDNKNKLHSFWLNRFWGSFSVLSSCSSAQQYSISLKIYSMIYNIYMRMSKTTTTMTTA